MTTSEESADWKLKLRYGKIKTEFQHFSTIAEGVVGNLVEGFSCRPGSAVMGMKVWASTTDEASDMARAIGKQIGFTVTGRIQIYTTEPEQPPGENPHGYSIKFTPFDNE